MINPMLIPPLLIHHETEFWNNGCNDSISPKVALKSISTLSTQDPSAASTSCRTAISQLANVNKGYSEVSRVSRTYLERQGYCVGSAYPRKELLSASKKVDELRELNSIHHIKIQFATFAPIQQSSGPPRCIYFTFKFYNCKKTTTSVLNVFPPEHPLETSQDWHAQGSNHPPLMLLCQGPKTDDKRSPGDPLEYHFDLSDMISLEARRFISYLKTRT